MTNEPLDRLVVRWFEARTGAERISVLAAIEARGPAALAAAARVTLKKGNADVVALISRALVRHAAKLPEPDRLIPLLESARRRPGIDSPLALAALDDALLSIGGRERIAGFLERIHELDSAELHVVVSRLHGMTGAEVALYAGQLAAAVTRDPATWSVLGPVLAHAAPHVRDTIRGQLRQACDAVIAQLRRAEVSPVTIASVCWVLAQVAEPGEALPRQLRFAVDRLTIPEAALGLCALCKRLATEESALVLVAMTRDPLEEVRTAARAALATLASPWVTLAGDVITARYEANGKPLERRTTRLVDPASGDDYVLDARGRPVRAAEVEYGGCTCCSPPRSLVRRRGDGVVCPSSAESHLRDDGRWLLERDLPVGRCKRCESVRPRVRDGSRILCLDCGAGAGWQAPPAGEPVVPGEQGRRGEDALPKPPTRDELEQIAPAIRLAIAANVFLTGRVGAESWAGSGIIVAREGSHVLVLTNRHVVEADDVSQRLASVRAVTVTGEHVGVSTVWRARRGIDLALVELSVRDADSLRVMPLGLGVGLVGSPVFAIGNPLGLAWSYTAGTLSAIRHWTTQEGQSVRILQTDVSIAPGSSGGGLFHADGHLLGVMSFLRQGATGGSAHFALSVAAVREAFVRESVTWRGRSLPE